MTKDNLKLEFIQKALRTIKNGDEIKKSITPKQLQILHSSHDLSEEVGELQHALKKHIFYNQELDKLNVIEELGDILANVHKLMNHMYIPEEIVYASAIDKISKRYPDGYNDECAKARADKEATNDNS